MWTRIRGRSVRRWSTGWRRSGAWRRCSVGPSLLEVTRLRRRPMPFQSPRSALARRLVQRAPFRSQRALLNQYCVGCHSQRGKTSGQEAARKITLDDLDVTHVGEHAEPWERVVRKLRAGMMPPAGSRRPDKATYDGLTTWLENELDRTAAPYTPPPGLHRFNRTEYANAIRDLLDLDIDPAKYLCRPTIRRTASTTSRARSAFRRRSSRRTSRRRARSAAWRSASRRRRRWSSTGRPKTRRRTITSKGCRSARAAACWSSTCSRPTASTRSP